MKIFAKEHYFTFNASGRKYKINIFLNYFDYIATAEIRWNDATRNSTPLFYWDYDTVVTNSITVDESIEDIAKLAINDFCERYKLILEKNEDE